VRFAALLAGLQSTDLQLTEDYSAAATLMGEHLDWLQQKIATSYAYPAPEFSEFAVVVAGDGQVATVFVPPKMIQDFAADEDIKAEVNARGAVEIMRSLLDCCGTEPGQRWSGQDPMQSLAGAVSLLLTLPPAEAARIGDGLEQCRKLGLSCCVVGLLGKNLPGKDSSSSTNSPPANSPASSLWPLFMPLGAAPQRVDRRLIVDQGLKNSAVQAAGPPRIQAAGEGAGAVPSMHADRVVGKMLPWIVAERQQRMAALKGILGSTPDANPQDQQRLVDKFKQIGGPFFPLVTLAESRKRGRYEIWIVSIEGWNRDTQDLILNRDTIPERPQLAASIIVAKGLGHHRHDIERRVPLIVSHHALSRLVQRSANRTVDDLLAAVTNLFGAYACATEIYGENSRLRFRTTGGEVIAQLEQHRDDSYKVIAKTILEIED
jgi:hypothetical protein